ncbi:radical SAM protein [Coraliomargarita sp. W4R53]
MKNQQITKIRMGPSGVHLFSRASGTNVLVDEIVPPEGMWSKAPRQVSIALTNSCDLSCSYCFAPKTRATLNFDPLIAWLDELDANGTIGVGFGGGEPTLYRRFAELCQYASQNTNLAVTFTTHGHHLNDMLLAKLKGHVHYIRVSMDGIGATYERLRRRSFESLTQRLNAIREISAFGINYVVNSDTLPEIDDAVQFAETAGASEFLLLPEQPVKGHGGISPKNMNSLQKWVERYTGKLRLSVSENGSEGLPTCNPFKNETTLQAYAHIDAHAVLKPTSYSPSGISISNRNILTSLSELQNQIHIS